MRVTYPTTSHIGAALTGLLRTGWQIRVAPESARLQRNGQPVVLEWAGGTAAIRLFIYKVTGSGRSQHERRIEITSTYSNRLVRVPGYVDIVLGYEITEAVFVGVDPRRISHGGQTANASSFIDPEALSKASNTTITVLSRPSDLFGVEHQAYFKPRRLAEYLANYNAIHGGGYDGRGEFSANTATRGRISLEVPEKNVHGNVLTIQGPGSIAKDPAWAIQDVWKAFEEDDESALRRKGLTQEDFIQLHKRQLEIGIKGEQHVLDLERRRLRRAGRTDLANRVSWISQLRPFDGYDIRSYETDGTMRFVEVKSTTGSGRKFPISPNEWRMASRKKSLYAICRVTSVESNPQIIWLNDPVALEANGKIKLAVFNWTIEYP